MLDLYGGLQSYLGGIAPGIAIGRAIEEQPALFAAVALNAPAPDMLRSETTEVGAYSGSEFGSTASAGGFAALAAMSPYEHVPVGTHLPPVLVRSGAPYDLGVDWQPAKFVARLQAASPLNVAYLGSMGAGGRRFDSRSDVDAFAFFLWADGNTR